MSEFRDRKVILIGYRCTGKSTVGRRLAGRLGLPFIDTDRLVEEAAGLTIGEMVARSGWPFFRQKECEAIKSLTSLGRSVIATGGGAVMDKGNTLILKQEGVLIWLVTGPEIIMKRMTADTASARQRPPLSSDDLRKEITDTLASRTDVYRRLADFSVDTGIAGINETVEKIVGFLK